MRIRKENAVPREDLWTRPQKLVALRTYMRLPFGRLHKTNPEIVDLAGKIGRTPGALAMKASNFASLDPAFRASGRVGLTNAGPAAQETWNEFTDNPEAIAAEAEEIVAALDSNLTSPAPLVDVAIRTMNLADSEISRVVRTRPVQSFFRAAVLTTYETKCAMSGISSSELLIASHIIPWSVSIERRADPRNGICLNALFDKAFDCGLFTFDDEFRVVVAPRLGATASAASLACSLNELEGRSLILPARFPPDLDAIRYHRQHVFQGE
jgi:putative restriction endonuclease